MYKTVSLTVIGDLCEHKGSITSIIIIIQHLYSAIMSYADTEAQMLQILQGRTFLHGECRRMCI